MHWLQGFARLGHGACSVAFASILSRALSSRALALQLRPCSQLHVGLSPACRLQVETKSSEESSTLSKSNSDPIPLVTSSLQEGEAEAALGPTSFRARESESQQD